MKKWILGMFILLITLISCTTAVPETEIYVPSFEVACITEAVQNYVDIRTPLPHGWEYKVIEETDDYGNEIFGIRFWPTEHPELSVRIGCRPGYPFPSKQSAGTRTTIDLPDGNTLWRHTKRKGQDAQSILVRWNAYPGLFYADYTLPDALEADYEPIIREILCFTQYGTLRPMQEAINMVCEMLETDVYAAFSDGIDPHTGAWYIIIQETENTVRRYFQIAADGKIREYFMEDQPMGGTGIVFRESEENP